MLTRDRLDYLLDPAHWAFGDPESIPARVVEHLSATPGSPCSSAIPGDPRRPGHRPLVRCLPHPVTVGNSWRALPTFGLLSRCSSPSSGSAGPRPPGGPRRPSRCRRCSPPPGGVRRSTGRPSTPHAAWPDRPSVLTRSAPIAAPLVIGGLRSAALPGGLHRDDRRHYVGLGGLGRLVRAGPGDYPRSSRSGCRLRPGHLVDLALAGLARLVVARPDRLGPAPVLRPAGSDHSPTDTRAAADPGGVTPPEGDQQTRRLPWPSPPRPPSPSAPAGGGDPSPPRLRSSGTSGARRRRSSSAQPTSPRASCSPNYAAALKGQRASQVTGCPASQAQVYLGALRTTRST